MKNLFYTLLILLLCAGFSQAQFDNPNLDQLPSYYRDMTPDYMPFAPIVTSDGYEIFFLGIDFAEPHISMNPQNPQRYFCAFNTNGTHYTINGLDWFVNNPNLPVPAGDPVTAYDSIGNLYYENMTGSSIYGCYVVKSTDNGQNWFSPVFAISGNDKNWIACDQTGGPYANYVYTTMTAGMGAGNFARSTDYGTSWQNTFTATTQYSPGMMVCVGPNVIGGDVPGGCVYVVTVSGSALAHVYTFYRSTDGGASFNVMSAYQFPNSVGDYVNGRNSVHNMRTRPYPFITADNSYGPYRGRLYLVYASNDPAGPGNKSDIYCRYSTDQGINWSNAVVVNDDPNSQNNYQWHPSIWCDKETGRLYIKWYDTRNCPTTDSCEVYATYSTNGGQSFMPNVNINMKKFRINCTSCGGGGTPAYYGDYDAVTSNANTSMICWTDFRNGNFGSYVAYFPDFAMLSSPSYASVANNDSAFFTIKVPSTKLYTGKVKFTAALDTMPTSGTITLSFKNGKDSITSYPDSVIVRAKTTGNVNSRVFKVLVTARGPNGAPAHRREMNLLVNSALLTIGTNREGKAQFKVNNVTYNSTQQLVFPLGSTVTVQALSPFVSGNTQYVFVQWSDNGDTTHNVTINGNLNLTAIYKTQFKLLIFSQYGTTFGGNTFYDSAGNFTFRVNSKTVTSGGTTYYFRGWQGSGSGSYTSPDSTGADSAVTWSMNLGPIIESVRWSTTSGINSVSSNIPKEFKLFNNYPNPFNPETFIRFDVAKKENVRIMIFDILGREITTLVNQVLEPGEYSYKWIASNIPSGVYFYAMNADSYKAVKRMMILK